MFLVGAFLGRNTVCCIRNKFNGHQCVLLEFKRTKKGSIETIKSKVCNEISFNLCEYSPSSSPSKAFMLGVKDRPISLRFDLLPGRLTICGEYGIYVVDVENEKTTGYFYHTFPCILVFGFWLYV